MECHNCYVTQYIKFIRLHNWNLLIMKHIILIALASIWLHSAQAITVHNDNIGTYVNVSGGALPKFMYYGYDTMVVKRIYVSITHDNLFNQATFTFQVAGEVVIDSNTRNYPFLKSGSFTISDTAYTNWNANDNTIPFQMIAPQLGLTIE